MTIKTKHLIFLSLLLCFILSIPFLNQLITTNGLLAQEAMLEETIYDNTSPSIVTTEEELEQWLYDHEYQEGTVFLGDNITITASLAVFTDETAPITINTGAFGLTFNGGGIINANEKDCLTIIGEGVNRPVIDVQSFGWLWTGNWNNELTALNITATGKNGQGGTALRISDIDDKGFNFDAFHFQGHIYAYGTNAVGIQLDKPADVYFFQVTVTGDGSKAIVSEKESTFYYCTLKAEGRGSQIAKGNTMILDTCMTDPPTTTVPTVQRYAQKAIWNQFYFPVKQNSRLDFISDLVHLKAPVFLLSGNDQFSEKPRAFSIAWDRDAYLSIDTSHLGQTIITGTPDSFFEPFGIFDYQKPTLTIEVRDPDIPCIRRVKFREDELGKYGQLYLWNSYDPSRDPVTLWSSKDNGKTWQDVTHDSAIQWLGDEIRVFYDTIKTPQMFCLELKGVGESNVAVLNEKDKIGYSGMGGDRTGADRENTIDEGELKPVEKTPDDDYTTTAVEDETTSHQESISGQSSGIFLNELTQNSPIAYPDYQVANFQKILINDEDKKPLKNKPVNRIQQKAPLPTANLNLLIPILLGGGLIIILLLLWINQRKIKGDNNGKK